MNDDSFLECYARQCFRAKNRLPYNCRLGYDVEASLLTSPNNKMVELKV